MLFALLINIIFDISTSNNIRISNIYAKKIAGNRCRTSGKYLPFRRPSFARAHDHRRKFSPQSTPRSLTIHCHRLKCFTFKIATLTYNHRHDSVTDRKITGPLPNYQNTQHRVQTVGATRGVVRKFGLLLSKLFTDWLKQDEFLERSSPRATRWQYGGVVENFIMDMTTYFILIIF